MPLISKQEIYPQDPNVTPRDYLIGTDRDNNKKTRTYSIASIGGALGFAGVRVQEIYLGFCPFATSEVSLEDQVNTFLDIHSIEVDFNTLIIFKVLHHNTVVPPSGGIKQIIPTQTNYYFTKGYGIYDPISSTIDFADLIIDYESQIPFNPEMVLNSPDAEVIDLGDIGEDILFEYLNNNGTYDLTDEDKTYYFRFEQSGTQFLYVFNANSSANGYGLYGDGELQFADEELLMIYSSALNYDIPDFSTSIPFGSYQIFKAEANSNPADIDTIQANDTIIGYWHGPLYDDTAGAGWLVNHGSFIRVIYNGGGLNSLANYTIKQAD